LAKLMIHTGDDRAVQDVGDIATVMLRSDAPVVRNAAVWILALIALSKGNATQAHGWLCNDGLEARLTLFPLFPHEITDDVQLIRIAKAVSDGVLGERVLSMTEQRAVLNPNVDSCRAVAAHVRGLWSGSAEDLGLATSLLRSGPRPLALASALEDTGKIQLRDGSIEHAVRLFDEALQLTGDCGATWDSARLRRRLRGLGVHRRYTHSDRPKSGWGSLTDAEVSVASLAADGQTNRQIAESLYISPHTVNTHMRHVFEKLGVNSRVQLTRSVRDHQ
jgi:DNA-binding CsgD family transcriptional regulator